MRNAPRVHCAPFFGGYSFGAGRASKKAGVYDIFSLTMSGLYRTGGTYSSSTGTWDDSSGNSRNLTQATSGLRPADGAGPGFGTCPDFDGTDDRLANAVGINTYGVVDGGTGFSIAVLLNPDALTGSIGNDVVMSDAGGGYFGIGFDSGNIHLQLFDGAYKTAAVAISTGAWSLFQCKWLGAGGVLRARINSGAWTGATVANGPDVDTGTLRVGADYTATTFYNGRIGEVIISPTVVSDGGFDDIKAYINDRYSLSL